MQAELKEYPVAELPFFPLATDAYLADCAHLSDAEHGRYLLLLMALWRAPNQRLPNDNEWLARRFNRTVEAFREGFTSIIEEFCQVDGNWITQKRLTKEFRRARKSVKQRSDAAKARWRKQKEGCERTTDTDSVRTALTPTLRPTSTPTDSVPNGTGGKPPKQEIFDVGLPWLVRRSGLPDKQCRAIVGKWLAEFGDDAVLAALTQAHDENPVDPVPWIVAKFKPRETHEQRRLREIREVLQ